MISLLSFKFIIVIALSNAFRKKFKTLLKFLVDFFIKISYIQEIIFDDINNCRILAAHKLIYLLTFFESM